MTESGDGDDEGCGSESWCWSINAVVEGSTDTGVAVDAALEITDLALVVGFGGDTSRVSDLAGGVNRVGFSARGRRDMSGDNAVCVVPSLVKVSNRDFRVLRMAVDVEASNMGASSDISMVLDASGDGDR